ncbi:hypothetical protein Tco_0535517 [Tanacetum coccineum]
MHGEVISQEYINQKFLRSLSQEWTMHTIVWRNKPEIETLSLDDLFNNLKAYESENMAFVSSHSSTNEVNIAYGDLEQIHEDDIEEMNLKWQLALLSMRTRRFFQKTSRKITINGSDTTGNDKSKTYMADDEVPTNMALMAFLDSEVHNDKTCSKTCQKSFETLKTQLDDLRIEFNKSKFNLATYKRGLAYVEEQLVFYKKNEDIFCEQLAVSYKDSELSMLKSELERLQQEKESNLLKIEIFDNTSMSLDKLIGSQITNKTRKGVGFVSYNVVLPPPTGLFSPPKFDLSNSGLEEFPTQTGSGVVGNEQVTPKNFDPEKKGIEGYGPKTSKSVSEEISNEVRESPDAPLVKELESLALHEIIMANLFPNDDANALVPNFNIEFVPNPGHAHFANNNNNNGWIEWDVPLREMDEPMVDSESDEEETDDEDDDGNVWMRLEPRAPYDVWSPSTAIAAQPSD